MWNGLCWQGGVQGNYKFHKLCKDKDKAYETLDGFVGFAKWVLNVEVPPDTEKHRQSIGPQRRTLCGNTYPVYNISPTTMRTSYVNGLAIVWNTEVKAGFAPPHLNLPALGL